MISTQEMISKKIANEVEIEDMICIIEESDLEQRIKNQLVTILEDEKTWNTEDIEELRNELGGWK